MTHRAAAVMTVNLLRAHDAVRRRLAEERGQGTVEYVGVILLVAGVLGAVVVWAKGKHSGIGGAVTKQIKHALESAGSGAGGP